METTSGNSIVSQQSGTAVGAGISVMGTKQQVGYLLR